MIKRVIIGVLAVVLVTVTLSGVAAAKDKGKSACKKGGWMELVDADGQPFANQGECVGYVTNGGVPMPPETVFAVAYTNVDGVDGYNAANDVLIAKLVDANGTGMVDAGDVVETNQYPLNVEATAFGSFQTTEHTVSQVQYAIPDFGVSVIGDSGQAAFTFGAIPDVFEFYQEDVISDVFVFSSAVLDFTSDANSDQVRVLASAPSSPDTVANDTAFDPTDNTFLDVNLFVPSQPPPPPPPVPETLAIAYTDVDPGDGDGFKDGTDVLISKLEDTNDDGVVSVGDTVITGQYPEDFAATTFGSFAVTRHVVDAVAGASEVRVGDFKFVWSDLADAEVYAEFNFINDPLGTATEFTDSLNSVGVFGEGILVNTTSPSVPDSNVNMSRAQQASDDKFIDVDILVP